MVHKTKSREHANIQPLARTSVRNTAPAVDHEHTLLTKLRQQCASRDLVQSLLGHIMWAGTQGFKDGAGSAIGCPVSIVAWTNVAVIVFADTESEVRDVEVCRSFC